MDQEVLEKLALVALGSFPAAERVVVEFLYFGEKVVEVLLSLNLILFV